MSSRRRACAFGLALAAAGCGTYPLRDTAQEQMARGEGPLKSIEDPPAAGDPGVVAGRLEAVATFAPSAPIAFEPVVLTRDGAVVSRTTSDAHGGFMFVKVAQPGAYEVRVDSARLVGVTHFSIRRAGAHISDLRLDVRPATAAQ
ncbi:MAG TPA: hypothetical protein VIF57_07325 [Polyangia bacterium]|jgi:hypothetical protein